MLYFATEQSKFGASHRCMCYTAARIANFQEMKFGTPRLRRRRRRGGGEWGWGFPLPSRLGDLGEPCLALWGDGIRRADVSAPTLRPNPCRSNAPIP